jgi:NADPH2:quinone reductase
VVNYRDPAAAEQVRAAAPDGVDRIVEVALAANLELDMAVTAPNAAIVSYATDGGAQATVPVRRLMVGNATLRFVFLYTIPRDALRRAVAEVSDALQAKVLTTLPLHRFPLERTADAHNAVEQGAVGKVVIDIP